MSMSSLESRSEVLKLARLLRTPPEELEFLSAVDPADLRVLREQVTDVLFEANTGVLQRMAAASKLLPAPVLAKIAERVFGPLLCARIAGLVEVSRGVDVAKRLSPSFLADVAGELDPRRARDIIAKIPADVVTAVAAELAARADWIAIGRFVGSLPEQATSTGLAQLTDSALLRVAFVLDDKNELDHIADLLGDERFDGLARQAAEQDEWVAAFHLLSHLGEANTHRLVKAVAGLDPELRTEAGRQADELGVVDQLGELRDVLT